MSLLQLYFTADAKFLTSFQNIAIAALGHGADRTFSFLLILAQHRLLFLLLRGSSSKDIRRTSVGRETFIFFLICHETQIYMTNSLNRTLWPKIWASYYSAEYCPRMRKRTFGWRESGLKRLCSSSLLKCWIISSCRMLCLHFVLLTWSPKPASRARRLNLWYHFQARLHPP